MHQEYPKMMKDQYWNEIFPSELPYTEATKHLQTLPFLGSAQAIEADLEYSNKKTTPTRIISERKVFIFKFLSWTINIKKTYYRIRNLFYFNYYLNLAK